MGCRYDESPPDPRALECRKVCLLITWLSNKLGRAIPHNVSVINSDVRGSDDDALYLNQATKLLCEMVTHLTETQKIEILYDGRVMMSRKLADWWETHQARDKAREAKEATAKKRQALVDSAKAKLTEEEWNAVTYKG